MRLNAKVGECLSVKKFTGDVGIEIECELNNVIRNDWKSKSWQLKGDGSLRGNGYEFVLYQPIKENTVDSIVKEWQAELNRHNVKINKSERTSVHVHRNVQDFTVLEAVNAVCTYWLAEPYLLPFCGESRKGNNFCLTLRDADAIHSMFIQGIKQGKTFSNLAEETYRYSSLNLAAINRFGSLECRLMRGTDNAKEISNWSKAINQVIGAGQQFKNPQHIIEVLDKEGPSKFLSRLLTKDLIQYFSGYSKEAAPENKILDNALYIYEIAEAKKTWDFLKDEGSLEKDFKKLMKIKMDYLTSLGYTGDKETEEFANLLISKDLRARNVTDFNKFLKDPVPVPAPPRRGNIGIGLRAAADVVELDDEIPDEPIARDFADEEDNF